MLNYRNNSSIPPTFQNVIVVILEENLLQETFIFFK